MFRDDYIIRLIKQLVAFIARMAGYRKKGEYQKAIDEAGRAWGELLGHPRELVDVVDTPQLAELLGTPERMRSAAQLLFEEGHSHAGKGDGAHAQLCYRRAYELYLEVRAVQPTEDDEVAILELSRHVHASQLDARYRST